VPLKVAAKYLGRPGFIVHPDSGHGRWIAAAATSALLADPDRGGAYLWRQSGRGDQVHILRVAQKPRDSLATGWRATPLPTDNEVGNRPHREEGLHD
jgi:hypothetical protein